MLQKQILQLSIAAALTGACVPLHLQKYRQQSDHRLAPTGEQNQGLPVTAAEPQLQQSGADIGSAQNATIYALDSESYRFHLNEREVWDAGVAVLMRNYNPSVVDQSSGIFSTEWDSYFLNGVVYRNKVSIHLSRVGHNQTDMIIHNNVEQLRDGPQTAVTTGAVWLPSVDPANEIGRIVKNMALLLGQPSPILQPVMARAVDPSADGAGVRR